jgi:alpha-N-arabinofuranosidase
MSRHGRGRVLKGQVHSETYAAAYYDPRGSLDQEFPIPAAPYLKLAAVATAGGGLSLFALNRDLGQPMTVSVEARGFADLAVAEALELRHHDLSAVNSRTTPDRVAPQPLERVESDGGKVTLGLAPASWNLITLAPRAKGA